MVIKSLMKVAHVLALALVLTSCSIFSAETSRSFDVFVGTPPVTQTLGQSFQRIAEDPLIYRTELSEGGEQIYLTPIEECGQDQEELKPAFTRQLFVGLSKLQVKHQQTLEMDGREILHWRAEGSLDETPLAFSSYTIVRNHCIRDIVLWSKTVPLSSEFALFSEGFQSALGTLFDENQVLTK